MKIRVFDFDTGQEMRGRVRLAGRPGAWGIDRVEIDGVTRDVVVETCADDEVHLYVK